MDGKYLIEVGGKKQKIKDNYRVRRTALLQPMILTSPTIRKYLYGCSDLCIS